MTTLEHRTFRLVGPGEPGRVVRGAIDAPAGGASHHVILLHGFKGFMDWGFFPEFARRIAERGMAAVRYNASGSGIGEDPESFTETEAFARNTLTREMEDLERVRTWIRETRPSGVDPECTSLLGHSRGASLALVHAAEQGDCRTVVAWAPVSTFDRFDADSKRLWREQGFLGILNARTGQELPLGVGALDDLEANRARFDVPAACRRLGSPVLLAHGTADESVSIEESRLLAAQRGGGPRRLLEIEGAGHTFGIRHPMRNSTESFERVADATLDWLQRPGHDTARG